MNPHSY